MEILGSLINILYVAVGLGMVIFFHELGHFAVAKWCDVHVERFSIGFGPIYNVMTGQQVTTPAFTSIFSFATYLKQQNPGDAAFIDALLVDHNIQPNVDIYGSNETNDGPGSPLDVFPLYTDITLGVTTNICVNAQFDDADRDGNKLSEHRFLRLNLPAPRIVTFNMTANPAPSQPSMGFDCTADPDDPDAYLHYDRTIAIIVSPKDCARCHAKEVAEFTASHHSKGGRILGSLDNKVPYSTGLTLYHALEEPELHVYPVGHYTGMIIAPRAATIGFEWLRRRFESP